MSVKDCALGDVQRLQGLGSEPYGVLRLALNYLRSSGLPLVENRRARSVLREALHDARVPRCEASLVDLEQVNRRLVYTLVDDVCRVVCEHAPRLFQLRGPLDDVRRAMVATLRRFTAKRNLTARLLTALNALHGDYRHGVVHWRKKGNMPEETLAEVAWIMQRVARTDNLAYMLDSSAKGGLHVHYLCSVETEGKIRARLRAVSGVQASAIPKPLLRRWEEREQRGFPTRDTTSYLAVKLTPGLQVPGIAKRVKTDLGDRDLGRVVCHTKANRLALESRLSVDRRPVGRISADRAALLIQRGKDMLALRD